MSKIKWNSPHPGLMGCIFRIPGEARRVALNLNGQVTSDDEAVALLTNAVGRGFVVWVTGPSDHDPRHMLLLMEVDARGKGQNTWRVLFGDPVAGDARQVQLSRTDKI